MASSLEGTLAAAQDALHSGRVQLCLSLASDAVRALGGSPPPNPSHLRQLHQLQALGRIELAAGSQQGWWQLLGLEEGGADSTPAEVRSRYRRLAAAVHPDKCALPGARHAFQKLQQGMEQLLEALEEGEREEGSKGAAGRSGYGEVQRRAKRQRGGVSQGRPASWNESGNDGEGVEVDSDYNVDWLASGNAGFPWWGEWDPTPEWCPCGQPAPAPPPPTAPGVARGQHQEAAGSVRGDLGSQADGSKQKVAADAAAEDERGLNEMSVDELRGEVRRRQDALLGGGPAVGAAGGARQGGQVGRLPVHELQTRLRRAKSILVARIQEQAVQDTQQGGGFLRGLY